MKLISYILLICNFIKCESDYFPLRIQLEKKIYGRSDFNGKNIENPFKNLVSHTLHKTAIYIGENNFPKELTLEYF